VAAIAPMFTKNSGAPEARRPAGGRGIKTSVIALECNACFLPTLYNGVRTDGGRALRESQDRTERRKHRRTGTPPLALRVGGQKYRALDWSLGGCRINDGTSRFRLKQQVEGRLDLEGPEARGEFIAEVVRVGDNGDVGLRWLELPPDLFVALGDD